MIAWSQQDPDGGDWDVIGQRLDETGELLGDAFRANTHAEGDQYHCAAAMDPNGGFLITWTSHDGDAGGIFARRFDASGTPIGDEFRVNETTDGNQQASRVTMEADGAALHFVDDDASHVMHLTLVGANSASIGQGVDTLAESGNDLPDNDPHSWDADVTYHGAVEYGNVYDGVDVRYHASGQRRLLDASYTLGDDGSIALAVAACETERPLVLRVGEAGDPSDDRADGRQIDVVLLTNDCNGISQITETLAGYDDLDAVHIVSHGTAGAMKLGSEWLTADNLDVFAEEMAGWQDALSSDADLLLYGCDLAGNEGGQTLIDSLSTLTGADVAASVDDTGHAVFGDDWDLEYVVGQVETDGALGADAQDAWFGILGVAPTIDLDADDSSDLASLTVTITNLLDGADEIVVADTTGTSISASCAGGVLTLSGSDSVANYQQVLRTVTYNNTSQNPNTTARLITFHAWDQTSGINGDTADLTGTYTVLDQFGSVSYINNDGTAGLGVRLGRNLRRWRSEQVATLR